MLGNPERYIMERLFIPESGQHLMAAYCDEDYYSAYGIMVATKTKPESSIKFPLALLNSKLITFYAIEKEILRKGKKATPHIGVKGLNSIPVFLPDKKTEDYLIKLVNNILAKKKNKEPNTDIEEREIDLIIYKLYKLKYEEVKIIEPEFGMSKEDYEAYEIEKLAKAE